MNGPRCSRAIGSEVRQDPYQILCRAMQTGRIRQPTNNVCRTEERNTDPPGSARYTLGVALSARRAARQVLAFPSARPCESRPALGWGIEPAMDQRTMNGRLP